MDIVQQLANISGWQSLFFMVLSMIVGGYYIKRSSKSKAEEIARNANKEAIEALQAHVHALQERIQFLEGALRELGIHVAIDGKIVHIKNGKES
jgi:hypothetical protein